MTMTHDRDSSRCRRPKVFGTGLVALDLVVSQNDGAASRHYAGGTCGNVLTILSFLGWDAFPISRLNGDFTSKWVLEDFKKWGVHTDFASLAPTGPVPVIIEWITSDKRGKPSHRYSFVCPTCGSRKPPHKPVLATAAKDILPKISQPDVFFFDRVSRASLVLAEHCREQGALVVFEPSGVGDPRMFREALSLSHILKYSNDRMGASVEKYQRSNVLLEIETQGDAGIRFRTRLGHHTESKSWERIEAFRVPVLKDAAGSGDWFTAALIDQVASLGRDGFEKISGKILANAVRFGQAAAAWNCGFEAPRGGMYQRGTALAFDADAKAILAGNLSESVIKKVIRSRKVTPINGACLKCGGKNVATKVRRRTESVGV